MKQLVSEQHIFVRALRDRAFGRCHALEISSRFADLYGRVEGARVALAHSEVLCVLAICGRRALRVGLPGVGGLTVDERALMGVFLSAALGNGPALAARTEWLVRPAGQAAFMACARALAKPFLVGAAAELLSNGLQAFNVPPQQRRQSATGLNLSVGS